MRHNDLPRRIDGKDGDLDEIATNSYLDMTAG